MAYKKNWKKKASSAKKRKSKKKYSFNERAEYHKQRYKVFVDKFRYTSEGGGSSIDFDKMSAAMQKNEKVQYSSGFVDAVNGWHLDDKATKAQRAGYDAGERAFEKSKNIKY